MNYYCSSQMSKDDSCFSDRVQAKRLYFVSAMWTVLSSQRQTPPELHFDVRSEQDKTEWMAALGLTMEDANQSPENEPAFVTGKDWKRTVTVLKWSIPSFSPLLSLLGRDFFFRLDTTQFVFAKPPLVIQLQETTVRDMPSRTDSSLHYRNMIRCHRRLICKFSVFATPMKVEGWKEAVECWIGGTFALEKEQSCGDNTLQT